MYLARTLEAFWERATRQFPVLLLTGARQVGKTTLLRHLSGDERTYVTLDDPLVLAFAKEEPGLFFQRYRPPVLIDEVQYAPELFPYIKMMVDEDREPGRVWLTGSQQFHLMRDVTESLAGRVGIVELLGFSRREMLGRGRDSRPFLPIVDQLMAPTEERRPLDLEALYRLIWRGSFPGVVIDEGMDRDFFYRSFVQTYLQRDVRDLANVGDELAFLRFMRAAAARTAQLLNLTELARDADVAVNTAKRWLSVLEASGIVYLLEPYHSNVTKRLVKAPKLYLLDTGLASYLTEWSSPATLEAGAMSGAILETWVMGELLRGYRHDGRRAPFYFYRDKDKREIDLLIVQDGTIYPLEIKKTASPTKKDVRHFKALHRLDLQVGTGGVICCCAEALPLTEAAWTIPVSAL